MRSHTVTAPAVPAAWGRAIRMVAIGFTATVPIVCWAVDFGVAMTASHILAFVLIAIAAGTWVATRRPLPMDVATVSFACFVVVATVSVVRVLLGPDVEIFGEYLHRKAVKQLAGLCFAFALFVAFRYVLQTFRLASTIAWTHFWTTAAVAVLAIIQFLLAMGNIESELANFPVYNTTLGPTRGLGTGVLLYGFPRVSLTFVEPSRLGIYLLTGWAFWLYGVTRTDVDGRRRTLMMVAGILVGAAALVTGSRIAHVVFVLTAAGAFVLRPHRLYRVTVVVASIAIAAALTSPWKVVRVAATLMPEDVPVAAGPRPTGHVPLRPERPLTALERYLIDVGTRSNVSAKHRVGSLFVAISVVYDYPLLGAGYGTSEFAMASRYPEEMGAIVAEGGYRPTMLGIAAVILTETGVLGTACVAGLLLGIAMALRRALRGSQARPRNLAWGMAAAIAVYLLAMSAQAIEVYQFLLAWVLLPVALALAAEAPED